VGELILLSRPGSSRIVVSFHNVEFISSTFLNRMILLRRSVLAAEGKLVLCGLNPVIKEIFEASRLDDLFDLSGSSLPSPPT
jgi:anti-sigma B factor antagonist